MDHSIRRRLDRMGYDHETIGDIMADVAENKQQDAYADARESAAALAKDRGYAVAVQAGDSYAVIAANTKARCHELLYGRRPLAEFDAKGEVK
jgi:hypothetical protein